MNFAVSTAHRAACDLLRSLCIAALLIDNVTAAPAAPDRASVRGLVVQLRDAPSHASLVRERGARALELAADASLPRAAREAARWQRVLAAQPSLRLASRRASGLSAQSLRFERALTHEQASALAERLAAHPDVAWAEPDVRERRLQVAGAPPGDPLFAGFNQQWWLQRHDGSDGLPIAQRLRGVPDFLTAWTQWSTGSVASRVAVLDSGITAHPELSGRVLPGYDMVADTVFSNDGDSRDADPSDPGDWVDASDLQRKEYQDAGCALSYSSWHGTAIAGMLFANTNNGADGAAMNWRGSVLPVRVATKCGADVDDIIDGMLWVAGLPACMRLNGAGECVETSADLGVPRARVVNISFGGTGSCARYQSTIDALRARGVVVVAAAGNEWTTPTRPAKCAGVIGVAALNRDGFKTHYSNFGPELAASGIATVGGDDGDRDARWSGLLADSGLLTITNNGDTGPAVHGYDHFYGTSFSTPAVAGAISLMLSVDPNLSYDQVVQGLRVSARPHVISPVLGMNECSASNPGRCLCTTQTCGAGILDVVQALAYAANPAGYTSNRKAESIDSTELRAAVALGPDRPPNPVTSPPDSGGGGGAMSAVWLAGLALAALRLARRRRSA
jgi:serine protease